MALKRRKVLIVAGSVFAALLLALLLIPVIFAGQAEARLQAEVERQARLRVSWSHVGLSFFRDFPRLTLSVSDLTAVGTGRFEGDTLAAMGGLRVAVDVGSAVRALRGTGALVVRSVRLEQPTVRLLVLEDGTANWDMFRSDDGGTDDEPFDGGSDFAVELQSFELTDGALSLDNVQTGLFASLEGLRHELSGNFSSQSLVAHTSAHADRTTVRFAGVPYLAGVALDLDADVEVDTAEPRVRLLDNEVRLNDLALSFSGEVAPRGEALAVDLTFAAPQTDFGQILSLVPALYATDFAALETSGALSLDGFVRGEYVEGSLPSFALNVSVDEGSFRYPDLPLAARSISADLSIDGPGGDVDGTVVSLSRFHMEIDGQPIDGAATLRTPVSDPDVDLRVNGTVDLADLARTVRLEGFDDLAGTVTADATVRARRSTLESGQYEDVTAEGTVRASQLVLRGERLRQTVVVEEAELTLSPRRAELRALSAQLGSSDLQATGSLDNVLAFAMGMEPLRGSGSFTSSQLILDEWRSGGLHAVMVPPRLDLTLDGTVDRLTFGALEMANARGRALIADERLTLEGFSLETLGGRVGLDGSYETTDPAQPTFAFDLAMDSLDISRASDAILTLSTFAPVARFARGAFSSDLSVSGAFRQDMTPVLDVLDGDGSVSTSSIAIEGFPLLMRLAEAVSVPRLAQPTVNALRSNVRIENGRLHVEPFQATVAGFGMTVSGSNGIDRSMDYTLGLTLPRSGLGDAAERAVQGLMSRAGVAGVTLPDSVRLGVGVTGTITEPVLGLRVDQAATSARDFASDAADAAVQQRIDDARQQADAATEEARQRARAQADSLVAEAEERAEAIRVESRRLADGVRAEGDRAAEELLARATNPVTRAAAQVAADRVRAEAEERAADIEREADQRADALVSEARERADQLVGAGVR